MSIGAEGFFGENSLQAKSNPQTWGGQIGQDFTENHRPSTIDFLTTHVWPDNWQRRALELHTAHPLPSAGGYVLTAALVLLATGLSGRTKRNG